MEYMAEEVLTLFGVRTSSALRRQRRRRRFPTQGLGFLVWPVPPLPEGGEGRERAGRYCRWFLIVNVVVKLS